MARKQSNPPAPKPAAEPKSEPTVIFETTIAAKDRKDAGGWFAYRRAMRAMRREFFDSTKVPAGRDLRLTLTVE